jgi:hypothetical protein
MALEQFDFEAALETLQHAVPGLEAAHLES